MLSIVLGGVALVVQLLAWRSGSGWLIALATILWLAAFLAKALADWLPLARKGNVGNERQRTDY
jgi:uncharacterized membrane protein YcjF (UPF0283 family)